MKRIRVLGGGWYGCHIALQLKREGHQVVLHESGKDLFSGASGNQPARLHLGFHYPRSRLTRAACQDHYRRFMSFYSELTSGVPINIYAIARHDSLVDFENYCQTLKEEVQYIRVEKPEEYGIYDCEGAVLTGERHVIIRKAREFFRRELQDITTFEVNPASESDEAFDLTVDCTFCARESKGVDRYEPCMTAILQGPTDKAVTIMDGPLPSLYPFDEEQHQCSLTSANLTPLTKDCHSYAQAQAILGSWTPTEYQDRCAQLVQQMSKFYPAVKGFQIVGYRLAVRAMPLSKADARLVDVVSTGPKSMRIRASKIDAIFYAEEVVKETIRCLP